MQFPDLAALDINNNNKGEIMPFYRPSSYSTTHHNTLGIALPVIVYLFSHSDLFTTLIHFTLKTYHIMNKQYIISPATLYDEDEMLWYTKVGVSGGHIPLHYTVWGKSESESRERSEHLVKILSGTSK